MVKMRNAQAKHFSAGVRPTAEASGQGRLVRGGPGADGRQCSKKQPQSDNNEVRPRFSGRDNGVASSQSGRTYR
jgi:hypothetical protein